MNKFLKKIQKINSVEKAVDLLYLHVDKTPKLEMALEFSIHAHKEQKRKSGEPYVVHPILVAAITAYFSGDEAMVISALLHDVVEDTIHSLEELEQKFGSDIAHIVDGLTKIVEIREHELIPSSSNEKLISSALTFRKMLLASIDDVRVLVVKLCDRLHNMLTLEALPREKQIRIAEETLVVYAPISHRLGISSIKNELEDLSFYYIYPQEYKKIDKYIKEQQNKIQVHFNKFISETTTLLEKNGYDKDKVQIFSRIKHYYSIFMKTQRKGVSLDEVLDLLAIRIIVDTNIDCYKVLGHIHMEFKPLISRFKDYVATPKENGYQTIHTTVFDDSKIYEIQIRTAEMHQVAEYGIAAHWKYKTGSINTFAPSLKWLHSLEYTSENIEEFYENAKCDLFSEEIVVYSPKGHTFTLPRGSTALDFAYAVHTDIGNKAVHANINKLKKPLLTELASGDIVKIKTGPESIARCSWLDMVKTSRAMKAIKLLCSSRNREIDLISGKNIVDTVFTRISKNITEEYKVKNLDKIPKTLDYLKHTLKVLGKKVRDEKGWFARLRIQNLNLKQYRFDNITLYSNFSINSVSFDHCCHPKFGDKIMAIKEDNKVVVHHKLCDKGYKDISTGGNMIFCEWDVSNKLSVYQMVCAIPSTRGEMAKLLMYLFKKEVNILSIEYGKDKYAQQQFCSIEFEIDNENKEEVRQMVEGGTKVIEFHSSSDAYK